MPRRLRFIALAVAAVGGAWLFDGGDELGPRTDSTTRPSPPTRTASRPARPQLTSTDPADAELGEDAATGNGWPADLVPPTSELGQPSELASLKNGAHSYYELPEDARARYDALMAARAARRPAEDVGGDR